MNYKDVEYDLKMLNIIDKEKRRLECIIDENMLKLTKDCVGKITPETKIITECRNKIFKLVKDDDEIRSKYEPFLDGIEHDTYDLNSLEDFMEVMIKVLKVV